MRINPRIFGAFLIGAGLISVAYFLAPNKGGPTVPVDASSSAVVGPAPKREPIKIADSDNDGLADWQEQFRRTDPVSVAREELEEPAETYTPPDTLTGELAIDLFSGVVQSDIRGPFGQSQDELIRSAERKIIDASQDELYTRDDITIIGDNSEERLRIYGNRVADIDLSAIVPQGTRSELEIIEHALRTGDEGVLTELAPRIEAYEQLVSAMRTVDVPATAVEEHLALLNAYNSLHKDLIGMQQAFEDPLYTMTRLKRYYNDAVVLNDAVVQLYTRLANEGAGFREGDRALELVRITEE